MLSKYRLQEQWLAHNWLDLEAGKADQSGRKAGCLACRMFSVLAPRDNMGKGVCVVASEEEITAKHDDNAAGGKKRMRTAAIRGDKLKTHHGKHTQAYKQWKKSQADTNAVPASGATAKGRYPRPAHPSHPAVCTPP